MSQTILWLLDKDVKWAWHNRARSMATQLPQYNHRFLFASAATRSELFKLGAVLQAASQQADIVFCMHPFLTKWLQDLEVDLGKTIISISGPRIFENTEASNSDTK